MKMRGFFVQKRYKHLKNRSIFFAKKAFFSKKNMPLVNSFMYIEQAHTYCERIYMLNFEEALKIATDIHQGQVDKVGGPYIDFMIQVANKLKEQGEPEEVQVLGLLQDTVVKHSRDELLSKGVPAELINDIEKLTYHKNQGYIDEYCCKLMENGMPAEEATYEARNMEFLKFIEGVKAAPNPALAKVKAAILTLLLEDRYIHRQERRELKTKYRLKKYQDAIDVLNA